MINFPMFFVEPPKRSAWRAQCKKFIIDSFFCHHPHEHSAKRIADVVWQEREEEQTMHNEIRREAYEARRWGSHVMLNRQMFVFEKFDLPWNREGFCGGLVVLWHDFYRRMVWIGGRYWNPTLCKPVAPEPIGEFAQMLDDIERAQAAA